MHLRYTNAEEIRQMNIHRWIESEKSQRDLGYGAVLDWIQKYAAQFRDWAETLPEYCVGCGKNCNRDGTDCIQPFDEGRIKYINDTKLIISGKI